MKKDKEVGKEDEVRTLVVKELPTQQITRFKDKDDVEYTVLTIEDALTELLDKVRENNKILKS